MRMGGVPELGIHSMVTIINSTGVHIKFPERVNQKHSDKQNTQNVLITYGD